MELFPNFFNNKVFRDPIHRYIYVYDRVLTSLIDCKEFQRLRRIRQLGTSSTTFHGAEHSRFNHSLGTYELVRRIIDEFFSKYMHVDQYDRLLVICAGLLHDIGHGPFSHSFEKVFQQNHELLSQKIILENTEVNKILQTISNDFPEKIVSILNKTHSNKLLISLISSQVDADRMDYLLRDSYYTGVEYGKFDLERLLRVIRPDKDGLVIKESGIHAVEDYIMSRYQMYRQIYFHPTSNGTEVLLTNIFERVKYLYNNSYKFNTKPIHFYSFFDNEYNIDIEQYIKVDDSVCLFYFNCWQDESDIVLSDLCNRFLNRRQFKYIPFLNELKNEELLAELKKIFRLNKIDPNYYLKINSSLNVAYSEFKPNTVDKQPVLIRKNDFLKEDLSVNSEIIKTISNKCDVYKYLYFPKDLIIKLDYKSKNKIDILLKKMQNIF